MNHWIYWIYGTDLFDGKEFAIDGATQLIMIIGGAQKIDAMHLIIMSRRLMRSMAGALVKLKYGIV